MNATTPASLPHLPDGVRVRWSRGLDALYPESERGYCRAVTLDIGVLFGRIVVCTLPGEPWLYLTDLPDHVASEVRFMEREAWLSWCERNGGDADAYWCADLKPAAPEPVRWFDADADEIPF